MDWEIELTVIIGKAGKDIVPQDALNHVAGYCVGNDVSERRFSEEGGGQWTKGKSADTFGPIGPWLVTKDEIPDPRSLNMWLDVNGTRMQESSTSEMIFSIPELISYVSEFMSLKPGDVLFTGTPYGTAFGRGAQYYLKPGDVICLGIDRLGSQRMDVKAWSEFDLARI